MKTILKVLLVLLLCYICFALYIKHQVEKSPMLDFNTMALKTLDGQSFSLNSDKPKVVNIWATWCAPCIKEFPAFQSTYNTYNEKVDFVMISDETPTKIQNWTSKNNYTFNFVTSENRFGTRPVTYFIQKDGHIISRKIGGLSEKNLEEGVSQLLENQTK